MKRVLILALALALVAALAAPMAVFAATDTTEISGTVGSSLVLQAPSAIDLGTMTPSATPYTGTSATPGSVKGNSAAGYSVTVVSNRTDGKMVSGSNTLTNALLVTTGTVSSAAVTTTPATCVDTSAPGTTAISLSVSQTIAYTDAFATGYTLTLTYTATAK